MPLDDSVRLRLLALVAVVAVLGVMLLAVPLGGPVQVSYAESDSMAPTLQPGDGYVVVPAGEVETGDVVVFWAPSRNEFVTHRVVGETAEGYVTKGDANERTDQANGYEPVTRAAIVGEVLTVAGTPVVVPTAGRVVPVVRTFRSPIFAGVLLVGAAIATRAWKRSRHDRPGRPVYRVRDVVVPLLVVGVLTGLAVTPLGADAYRLTYVASEPGEPGAEVVVGEPTTREMNVDVSATPFVQFVVDGEGLTVDRATATGDRLDVQVTLPPPARPGVHQAVLRVYPYPGVLPHDWLVVLHRFHPLAAVLGSLSVVFGPLVAGYTLLVDGSRPIPALSGRRTGRRQP
ncbi:signal peptidase I [Halorarius halobius]|uniref:signal peptidase I n=1 Tax=Halorarius halobius TaxID=2962671 RepID=UPI0020CF9386|nr:signal peptidase I [Halorarius halobius]